MNHHVYNNRYLSHDLNIKFHVITTFHNDNDINFVCHKYHRSCSSLWRWNKKFDSSIDKSHKPFPKHPNTRSDMEIKWIKDIIRRNPRTSLL